VTDNRPRLFLLGASHHTAPLAIRERIAIAPDRLPEIHRQLRELDGVRECCVLNTCNRLELYVVADGAASEPAVEAMLCGFQGFPPEEFTHHRFHLRDAAALTHLLEVAVGADSQIVGEAEIFGQVKAAYTAASAQGATGPVLNRVFQKAFQAGKFIRSNTPIGEGQVSIATVAVELANKIFGELTECRVLVVGTGEVAEKTVKALHSRGVRAITVLSRFRERAEALAATFGARAGMIGEVEAHLHEHDIVVGSTIANEPVVTAPMVQAALRKRQVRPLFLIDMGIPRNFDPAAGEVDSVFLYDLDDLARIADENLSARRGAVERCRGLAQEKAERIWEGVAPRLGDTRSAVTTADLAPDGQTS
jgi:glutamyl-tRNA reductase